MHRALAMLLAALTLLAPLVAPAPALASTHAPAARIPERLLVTEKCTTGKIASGTTEAEGHCLFLQRDPSGYADSVNLYAALGNDPINQRDPTGRMNDPRAIVQHMVAAGKGIITWFQRVAAAPAGAGAGVVSGAGMVLQMINSPGCDEEAQRANVELANYNPKPGAWSDDPDADALFSGSVEFGKAVGFIAAIAAGKPRQKLPAPTAIQEPPPRAPVFSETPIPQLQTQVPEIVDTVPSPGAAPPAPEPTVSVFHGSINNGARIRESGLDPGRGPVFVSRDLAAARDALINHPDAVPGAGSIIESRIPASQFESILAPMERPYTGFYPYRLRSTEITLRTPEQIELFNQCMVK